MIEGDPDPDPYLLLTNPDPGPGGLKTYGSYGSGTLRVLAMLFFRAPFLWLKSPKGSMAIID